MPATHTLFASDFNQKSNRSLKESLIIWRVRKRPHTLISREIYVKMNSCYPVFLNLSGLPMCAIVFIFCLNQSAFE